MGWTKINKKELRGLMESLGIIDKLDKWLEGRDYTIPTPNGERLKATAYTDGGKYRIEPGKNGYTFRVRVRQCLFHMTHHDKKGHQRGKRDVEKVEYEKKVPF